ncbi:TetR/AcrR family transcriptional regulator [Allonocardiopsis opalescens]|uniref:TetR family transcriptional regulator n=1 Tax=Allonocardiopsis opalescens TaxID=1144618 RepID=A0A2T0Q323_9ACTN|nr:TetR/AcrR family transcriptional regulator [Allonocardiopsis opalescens]PRX98120.1 TetR family transcriptional regulator [Allonocardiopsis opalescens]
MTADVPTELVEAALAAARERGSDVAEVPVTAIAAAAGLSRSTLLRRLGGSRAPLDAAVRRAGVDPGGRPPVRERAMAAAARLIGERGIGALTLDAVAEAAECSLPTLHTVFAGRDGLLRAMFERHGPVLDLERLAADPPERIEDTVEQLYRALVVLFEHEPRVLPAIFADVFSRPDGPGARVLRENLPRMLGSLGPLLAAQVAAGRLRPWPIPLLIQQLLGPLAIHMLLRPTIEPVLGDALPPVEDTVQIFADAFLRAAALPGPAEDGGR